MEGKDANFWEKSPAKPQDRRRVKRKRGGGLTPRKKKKRGPAINKGELKFLKGQGRKFAKRTAKGQPGTLHRVGEKKKKNREKRKWNRRRHGFR